MNAATETVRSNNRPVEPRRFGSVCSTNQPKVATDVWAYLLDEQSQETCYIGRVGGRKVGDIAADIKKSIKRMNFEWATLGQEYQYNIRGKTANDECPRFDRLAVYVTEGGSEGHLVHVDMMINDEDSGHTIAVKLFMVKTFAGAKGAKKIAAKLEKLLGVLQ